MRSKDKLLQLNLLIIPEDLKLLMVPLQLLKRRKLPLLMPKRPRILKSNSKRLSQILKDIPRLPRLSKKSSML
jgi:hypothetical protein